MADYIKREDAIDTACSIVFSLGGDIDDTVEMETSMEEIPAADVRPVVRGKWRLYSPLTDTYECDKCGYQVIDESFRTNFCPNCGAECKGTKEEK